MSREAESWFMEESVISESEVTEVSRVESHDSTFDFEVSERTVKNDSQGNDYGNHDEDERQQENEYDTREEARDDSAFPENNRENVEDLRQEASSSTVSNQTGELPDTGPKDNGSLNFISLVLKEQDSSRSNEELSMEGRNDCALAKEESRDGELSYSSTERARANQEAIVESQSTVTNKEKDGREQEGGEGIPSSKSELTERSANDDVCMTEVRVDLSMTDYSQAYSSDFVDDSDSAKEQLKRDEESEEDEIQDFRNERGVCSPSESESEARGGDDRYNVKSVTSSMTEQSTYDHNNFAQTKSSDSNDQESSNSKSSRDSQGAFGGVNASEVADVPEVTQQMTNPIQPLHDKTEEEISDDFDVSDLIQNELSVVDSLVTEKSLGGTLASTTDGSLERAISDVNLSSFEGAVNDALNCVISRELSEALTRDSRSIDETIESSVREKISFSFEASMDSYEGTLTSEDGTAGTATDFSTIMESYSEESDDPLKMFDFVGWVAETCGAPESTDDRTTKSSLFDETEGSRGPRPSEHQDTSTNLQKKLDLLTDYVKMETPLKNLKKQAEDSSLSRAPLSPKSTATNNTNSFFGKTPKHANTSSTAIAQENGVTEITQEESDHASVESKRLVDDDDENAATLSPQSSSPRIVHLSSRADSVSTGSDTIQAGIRRMQLQTKVLSGARKKMEAAMLQRHRRATAKASSSPQRSGNEIPVISENSETLHFSRNRWKKQTLDYADTMKRKSPRRRNRRRDHAHRSRKTNTNS